MSFDIELGEAVGIVGINGAGKSTLLKIIAGVVRPTTGTVEKGGRVSALLELGTGFHPDFTGRQNVYMSGQLKGLTKKELDEKIKEIEDFAEIGDYFDQPLRTYSSGMQARLAFSLATAVRPEILIVDEVLSVGDAAFQRKCFRRIEEFMANGTSLLYVSHSIDMVRRLCNKALFLHQGSAVLFGSAREVCDEYEKFLFGAQSSPSPEHQVNALGAVRKKPSCSLDPDLPVPKEISYGDGRATIEDVWLEDEDGYMVNVLQMGCRFTIKYRVLFHGDIYSPIFAFLIKTIDGIPLYGSDTKALSIPTGLFKAGDVVEVSFRITNRLAAGVYFLNCGVRDDSQEKPVFIHRRIDVLMFKVSQDIERSQAGLVNLGALFSMRKL
ncbi:MAG: ABC transporter ATP-binding protein [Candidatus Methanomethyliaceae archaeon]